MAVNLNPQQTEINREWIMKNLRRCKNFQGGANNDEYIMCSPLRKDNNPSFSVNAEKGTFNDFGTGEKGTLTELAKLINVNPPAFAGALDKQSQPVENPRKQAARQEKKKVEKVQPQEEKTALERELAGIFNAANADISWHPYVQKKGINPNISTLRVCTSGKYAGWLIVPAMEFGGKNLTGIQYISPDGAKRNHEGGKLNGAISYVTTPDSKEWDGKEVILCEGVATAATVQELRPNALVFCAFSSVNLPLAAKEAKAYFPEATLIIAADSGKAGEKAFKEIIQGKQATADDAGRLPIDDALKAIPRKKKIIPSDDDYPENTDWNDIATEFGKDFAAEELDKCIKWEKIFRDIQAQAAAEQKIAIRTGADLFATEDEPLEWIVENLIPEGLTVLAGHPKKGKSFLALQMTLAVAAGENFMGLATKQGTVLHMALEDGARRTKERIKHLGGRDAAREALFAFNSPRFNENGLRELLNIIRDAEPVLIVVDVWNAVKPPTQKNTGKNAYEADHEAASILNKLGTETHTAILMVHHLRKGAASSEIMTEGLSGSMGLPAAASAILTLLRDDESQYAVVHRTGRDYEDDTPLPIHFSRGMAKDGESFGWRPARKEEIDENSEPKNKNDEIILNILRPPLPERFKDGMTIKQIAARTDGNMKRATLYKRLKYLTKMGEIRKTDDEKYQLTESDAEESGNDYGASIRAFEKKFSQPEETHLDIPAILENGRAKQAAKVNNGQTEITLPDTPQR